MILVKCFFKQANYLIFLEEQMHSNNEQVSNIISFTTNIISNEFPLKVLLQTIRDMESQQCIMYKHRQSTHIVCVHDYGNKMSCLSEWEECSCLCINILPIFYTTETNNC